MVGSTSVKKTTDINKKHQPKADPDLRQGKKGFADLGSLFDQFQLEDKGGYITQEFQDFGYRLAVELNDMKHKSLYIKMAKEVDRAILEQALSFVADSQALSKAKLFMWKVKQLKASKKP